MSARRATPDPAYTRPRFVVLTDDDHAELGRLASRLRQQNWTSSAAWLEDIAARYADAPNPVGLVRGLVAIIDQTDEDADRLLWALGWPA